METSREATPNLTSHKFPLRLFLMDRSEAMTFVIDQGYSDSVSCHERLVKRGFSEEKRRQPELYFHRYFILVGD
jgi:hypothetical protein